MTPTTRIVVNTLVQYLRSVLNICLALVSTRLVLQALSVDDYGLYSVIAGVVTMLGFITNAMVVTTQRFLSYNSKGTSVENMKTLFTTSVFLHIIIAILLTLVLVLLKDWLVFDFLKIEAGRRVAAASVYLVAVGMLLLTIIIAPFKALFIAHENIVYLSVVEIIDAVIKFLLAFSLIYARTDKLLFYSYIMGLIQVFNLFALTGYAIVKYKECTIIVRPKYVSRLYLCQLLSFAGWSTYSMGAVTGRNQGISIVFNKFFGTTINAAYGIATQVFGAFLFVSSSIINAMNPQIIQAEGCGDHKRMFSLALKESFFSTTMMAIVAVPLMVELPSVLSMWLTTVPDGTTLFCRFIFVTLLCDQLTYGLHTIVLAKGNIGKYTLMIYTPKLLTPVAIFVMLMNGYSVMECMCCFLAVESLASMVRLPYCVICTGLDLGMFFNKVVIPVAKVLASLLAVSYVLNTAWSGGVYSVINIGLSMMAGMAVLWFFAVTKEERDYIRGMVYNKIGRR